jgi:ribosomal protein L40E
MRTEEREIRQAQLRKARLYRMPQSTEGEARMHQITFCIGCEEPIPVHALACFRCGTRQPSGERALQVVFCEKCGRDYPARSMSCHHCGHINPKHPYIRGHYAS